MTEQIKLDEIEQYRLQMAAISTAALGYWTDSDGIQPEYDTVPLRDVAKLYAKYDALHKAANQSGPIYQIRGSLEGEASWSWRDTDLSGYELHLPEWRRIVYPAQQSGSDEAFYELAMLLDIPAQSVSPVHVWRDQMLPRLKQLQQASVAQAQIDDCPVCGDNDRVGIADGKLHCGRCHGKNQPLPLALAAGVEAAQQGQEDIAELRRLSSVRPELNLSNYGPDEVDEGCGWISVADRLPETGVVVLVYEPARPDDYPDDLRISMDYISEDWEDWNNHCSAYEHFMMIGGAGAVPGETCTGPSEKAPYTHWCPLPAAPGAAVASPAEDSRPPSKIAAGIQAALRRAEQLGVSSENALRILTWYEAEFDGDREALAATSHPTPKEPK